MYTRMKLTLFPFLIISLPHLIPQGKYIKIIIYFHSFHDNDDPVSKIGGVLDSWLICILLTFWSRFDMFGRYVSKITRRGHTKHRNQKDISIYMKVFILLVFHDIQYILLLYWTNLTDWLIVPSHSYPVS